MDAISYRIAVLVAAAVIYLFTIVVLPQLGVVFRPVDLIAIAAALYIARILVEPSEM